MLLFQNCGETSQFQVDDLSSEMEIEAPDGFSKIGDMIVANSFIEGDDSWDKEEALPSGELRAAGVRIGRKLWPEGILPIRFNKAIPSHHRNLFMHYCNQLSEVARVKCIPRTTQRDYIAVRYLRGRGIGGMSYLGRIGGVQSLYLGRGSFGRFNPNPDTLPEVFDFTSFSGRTFPTGMIIQHEILHALGIAHEQNRYDRDQFIKVNISNVKGSSWKSQFSKIGGPTTRTDFYDYDSIMHYPSLHASNGRPTMTRRKKVNGSDLISVNYFLSDGDAEMLRILYGRP